MKLCYINTITLTEFQRIQYIAINDFFSSSLSRPLSLSFFLSLSLSLFLHLSLSLSDSSPYSVLWPQSFISVWFRAVRTYIAVMSISHVTCQSSHVNVSVNVSIHLRNLKRFTLTDVLKLLMLSARCSPEDYARATFGKHKFKDLIYGSE